MKTRLEYFIAINAASLAGFNHFAAALLSLYSKQYPEPETSLADRLWDMGVAATHKRRIQMEASK